MTTTSILLLLEVHLGCHDAIRHTTVEFSSDFAVMTITSILQWFEGHLESIVVVTLVVMTITRVLQLAGATFVAMTTASILQWLEGHLEWIVVVTLVVMTVARVLQLVGATFVVMTTASMLQWLLAVALVVMTIDGAVQR